MKTVRMTRSSILLKVACICSNSASRTASCLRSSSFSSAVGPPKSLFIWYGSPYLSSLLCRIATAWYKNLLVSVHSCRYLSLEFCHFILRFELNFMGLDSMPSTIRMLQIFFNIVPVSLLIIKLLAKIK